MSDEALIDLYENHLPFRLYIEHRCGVSVADLAACTGLSVDWVHERVEAMRLTLEKQVRLSVGPFIPDGAPTIQMLVA